jgi:hypothetical protein
MTEGEWQACTDPKPMLEFLRDKTRERKLRLFACACWRRIWSGFTHDSSRRAVECLEMFEVGTLSMEELSKAAQKAQDATQDFSLDQNFSAAKAAAHAVSFSLPAGDWWLDTDAVSNARHAALYCAFALNGIPRDYDEGYEGEEGNDEAGDWLQKVEETEQCHILREIIGNPFRPISAWLTPKVKTLAQAIYDDRAFERLPELADALAEAGSSNQDILSHCRGPGPHVRGCWVVDLVLGKE